MRVDLCVFGEENGGIKARLEGVLAQVGLRIDGAYYDPDAAVYSSVYNSADYLFVFGVAPVKNRFNGSYLFSSSVLDGAAENKIIAELKEKFSYKSERIVFSLYGNIANELYSVTNRISADNGHIGFYIRQNDRRFTVDFLVKNSVSPIELDGALKTFITTFSKEIYADEDVSVEQRFFDVLKLYKRRVRFAESMTGGNIAATIVKLPGATEVVYEGFVTYDTRSKYERLGVSEQTVKDYTVVSGEIAYQMVSALIDENASVGIAITGYAPSLRKNENDGLCYIGVAVEESVKVYRFVFSGDRETVIKKATEAAIFSALKLVLTKG